MVQLLVSVRSAAEAETVIAGGADWIDIKEPARGSLGRADDTVIREIIHAVAGRRPISLALGELLDDPSMPAFGFTGLVKVGLAGCAAENWRERLGVLMERVAPARLVPVAYADGPRAGSPRPDEIMALAIAEACRAFLIDTWRKDGRTLLDWCPPAQLLELAENCQRSKILFAVAGSLTLPQVDEVLAARPDLIAVRGAACRNRARGGTIDRDRVQALSAFCHSEGKFTTRTEGSRCASSEKVASTYPP